VLGDFHITISLHSLFNYKRQLALAYKHRKSKNVLRVSPMSEIKGCQSLQIS